MEIVNIHQAKTHLSSLVDRVVNGTGFIIAKAGKPMVKVVPLDTPDALKIKRLGFLKGQLRVPEGFDRMGDDEIGKLFGNLP